jgi:hypothetical protein
MAHPIIAEISMMAFQNTYPCSSEPCRGEDINANVTVDYEKLGVNGTIYTYFPISPMQGDAEVLHCFRLGTAAGGSRARWFNTIYSRTHVLMCSCTAGHIHYGISILSHHTHTHVILYELIVSSCLCVVCGL